MANSDMTIVSDNREDVERKNIVEDVEARVGGAAIQEEIHPRTNFLA